MYDWIIFLLKSKIPTLVFNSFIIITDFFLKNLKQNQLLIIRDVRYKHFPIFDDQILAKSIRVGAVLKHYWKWSKTLLHEVKHIYKVCVLILNLLQKT